jgi:hypothetical protein
VFELVLYHLVKQWETLKDVVNGEGRAERANTQSWTVRISRDAKLNDEVWILNGYDMFVILCKDLRRKFSDTYEFITLTEVNTGEGFSFFYKDRRFDLQTSERILLYFNEYSGGSYLAIFFDGTCLYGNMIIGAGGSRSEIRGHCHGQCRDRGRNDVSIFYSNMRAVQLLEQVIEIE